VAGLELAVEALAHAMGRTDRAVLQQAVDELGRRQDKDMADPACKAALDLFLPAGLSPSS